MLGEVMAEKDRLKILWGMKWKKRKDIDIIGRDRYIYMYKSRCVNGEGR